MAKLRPKVGPLGIALTAYDVWRRLPPRQRKQVLDLARRHGPRVAARVIQIRKTSRRYK